MPPGARLVAGLLLMVMGVFGFLPVLGFWMIPLGVAVAALDVVPVWRGIAGRLERFQFRDVFGAKRRKDRH
ncbi:hypothetical protein [Maritimibacter sp. UBA3975]|uniref:hypothetical protein n=1 Tax=Maritimibacter sp. UBA3975 TaxID=1946833 RepID=UPI0025BAFAA2|nr:hypothetical protein [Maritimibacter sp. UBA3975]